MDVLKWWTAQLPSSRWMGCLKQEQVLMAVTGRLNPKALAVWLKLAKVSSTMLVLWVCSPLLIELQQHRHYLSRNGYDDGALRGGEGDMNDGS